MTDDTDDPQLSARYRRASRSEPAGEQLAADCLAAGYRQRFLRPVPDR